MKVYINTVGHLCGQLVLKRENKKEYTWIHTDGVINDNAYPLEDLQKTHCLEYEDLWMAINLLIELGVAKEVDDK